MKTKTAAVLLTLAVVAASAFSGPKPQRAMTVVHKAVMSKHDHAVIASWRQVGKIVSNGVMVDSHGHGIVAIRAACGRIFMQRVDQGAYSHDHDLYEAVTIYQDFSMGAEVLCRFKHPGDPGSLDLTLAEVRPSDLKRFPQFANLWR